MRAICFLLQRTDHTEHIYQNSHIFSWKWCDETRLFTCWTGLKNISEFLFTKSGPQSWNWKWSVGSSSMCQSTRNYSMLWNLYISCSASLRALRSREPRGLQEKKMFWSKWHTLQGGHCAFSFPWVPSSLHQPNHRDDLEEDSLAIRPVSLFSPPLHLPLSLPPFSSFNPPPLSRTVWFIWPGWRQ